jgi:hypothetical protein
MKQKTLVEFRVEFDNNPTQEEITVTKHIVFSNTSIKRIFRNLMAQYRSQGATGVQRIGEWDK